ncbi:Uncharacterised protein [uncultured archaeon]|nr:Uncharacterised protein [uncultured archaeon]
MPEPTTHTTGSPVKKFVSQTIKEITDGLPKDYALTSNIDFELSVVSERLKKGEVDLKVLNLGGNASNQSIQKVRFSVGDPKKAEQQTKRAFKMLKEELIDIDKKTKRKK